MERLARNTGDCRGFVSGVHRVQIQSELFPVLYAITMFQKIGNQWNQKSLSRISTLPTMKL